MVKEKGKATALVIESYFYEKVNKRAGIFNLLVFYDRRTFLFRTGCISTAA